MFNFFKKMLMEEVESYFRLKYISKLKLSRSYLTPDERKEEKEIAAASSLMASAILNLEYTMRTTAENNFRGFVVYGEFKETNGKVWPNFYTYKKIFVKGQENRGPQEKAINLKFSPTIDTSFLRPGYLVVEKSKCTQPKIYEIKTDEKGIKHYPYIWIDEVYSFDEYPFIDPIPEGGECMDAKLKVQYFSKRNGQYIQAGENVKVVTKSGNDYVCMYNQCYYVIPETSLEFIKEEE